MQLLVVALAISLSASQTDGECIDGDLTHQEGEVWGKEGECSGYTCLEDGTSNVTECDLKDVAPGWTLGPADSSKTFPDCCGSPVPPMDIVPDVLDNLKWADLLDVTYDGDLDVDVGNELDSMVVKEAPEVSFAADPSDWHLLLMTNPDFPSRKFPKLKEVQHWLVGNIPGFNVSAGEVISEYLAPEPKEGSGLHRYVFLVYKQFGKLTFDKSLLSDAEAIGRAKFSTMKFAEKYNLSDPIALNVFQTQWDNRAVSLRRLKDKGDATAKVESEALVN